MVFSLLIGLLCLFQRCVPKSLETLLWRQRVDDKLALFWRDLPAPDRSGFRFLARLAAGIGALSASLFLVILAIHNFRLYFVQLSIAGGGDLAPLAGDMALFPG